MINKKINIGTSGWVYNHWKGIFYPEVIPGKDMLNFYSKKFNTVEINYTFYKLPKIEDVINWVKNSPDNFLFSVKASRFITHMKNLKDPQESTKRFFEIIENFNNKLGPILFQLSPHWHINSDRLENFLEKIPSNFLYTFELRHKSWFNKEIYDILKKYNVALCFHDYSVKRTPIEVTSEFIYIRFHGSEGGYFGYYNRKELEWWAKKIKEWDKENLPVFVYFNNDAFGNAIKNAIELKDMLGLSNSKYES
jgi:uncharacterized protein YecE (DUF72 family)